jgi:hypothetical protein
MCPQLPRLSPEYSHKAGLQTVITGMPLQIRPVTHGGHAGPVTMGRIARGPLSWTRPHCGMPFVAGLRLVRNKRRVSLPVLFLLAQLLQRRLRAKGGAFAFAPTHRAKVGPNNLLVSRKLGDRPIGHLLVPTSKVIPHILLRKPGALFGWPDQPNDRYKIE